MTMQDRCKKRTVAFTITVLIATIVFVVLENIATAETAIENPMASNSDNEAEQSGDIVCGPRCVHYLLQHYRHSDVPPLMEIVREVQWPDYQQGASMADLKMALESRGVHCVGIKFSPGRTLAWKHPCLVHLESPKYEKGHYVVWLPQSTRATSHVWFGPRRIVEMPAWKLSSMSSGYALLTDLSPAVFTEDVSSAVVMTADALLWLFGWVGIGFASIVGYVLSVRHSRSTVSGKILERASTVSG